MDNSENIEKKTIKMVMTKLYDYNVYDGYSKETFEELQKYKDNKKFIMQLFGINNNGTTTSIIIEDFTPYFYISIGDNWTDSDRIMFIIYLKAQIGNYYEDSIIDSKLIKQKKLYGFDNNKLYTFIKIYFKNTLSYNKVKNLFYKIDKKTYEKQLKEEGLIFNNINCYLYEADIPPLLKFFHLKKIQPCNWVMIPVSKIKKPRNKISHCTFEYIISYKDIHKVNKDDIVKYNICSFDIEASSSHGDFPLAIKNYRKLATNIVDNYIEIENKENYTEKDLHNNINAAFGYGLNNNIDKVYTKAKEIKKDYLDIIFDNFIKYIPVLDKDKDKDKDNFEENEYIEESESDDDSDYDEEKIKKNKIIKHYKEKVNILEILKDNKCDYETKILELNKALTKFYPPLEGDQVTFIGLSFLNYTENKPYKRYIIVKGGCKIPDKYKEWAIDNNVIVITKKTEREVLLSFTKIIQQENPHIITGYNINGFDFEFMFKRTKELGIDCMKEFSKLSFNIDEICLKQNWKINDDNDINKYELDTTKVILSGGEYNLKFYRIPGRIIIDMCVIFRREFILSSYKLDYVSSYFISDKIKSSEIEGNTTKIYSKNLAGLTVGCYIKLEEQLYSTSYYKNGKKFEVINIDKNNSYFTINSAEYLENKKKMSWGLAKDDVSPQEIFKLSNGSDYDRWIVAKYCLGDCDNVLELLLKLDIITEKNEMANLVNVPFSFLLERGQGIKLQSYVSLKCGEKNTLMPVLSKHIEDDGYEGAHVFNPKTGIYLEDPVACVDYSSLYPSSMISENISHDSKVWTKEYDLENNLIKETGYKDEFNNYLYDNLPEYKYVDIKYDTYKWKRITPKAAPKKMIVGYKICRYAQFPNGKAIMPSILEELLIARKMNKKLMAKEEDIFKKNLYDKRQLAIKVTANSLYGQSGAKTSAFYDKDVAASTTAIGRKLLFYAKDVIEECYNNISINVNDGNEVKVKAECVYGDTDSVFFKFNLRDNNDQKIINKQALIYTIELAKQAGNLATMFLKKPHDLEYEKTFHPFNLYAKKRYDGMLYEEDPNICKLKSMGNVLKRRDNAPIVKDIYGGVIDIIMLQKNIPKSINYINNCIEKLLNNQYDIDKLTVVKALRGHYKNPKQIAHKVLADKIGIRDPGNKPKAGDRIPYVYIVNKNKNALQGDKIETPKYVLEHNLDLDTGHYLTNQIMKPLLQLYALVLTELKEFKIREENIKFYGENKKNISWETKLKNLKDKWTDETKYIKKLEELKHKEIKELLFDNFIKKIK